MIEVRARSNGKDWFDVPLDQVIHAGARSILVDVTSVDAIPQRAVGPLLDAFRACRSRGGELLVRNPSRRAMEQLDRTGVRVVFQVGSPAVERTPR